MLNIIENTTMTQSTLIGSFFVVMIERYQAMVLHQFWFNIAFIFIISYQKFLR